MRRKVNEEVQKIAAPIPHKKPASKKAGYFSVIKKTKEKKEYEKIPRIIPFLSPIIFKIFGAIILPIHIEK